MSFDLATTLRAFERAVRVVPGSDDAMELQRLLAVAPVTSLIALDRAARAVHIDDEDVRYRYRPSADCWVVLSMTRMGALRLDAVRMLTGQFDRLSLAALLLRLDDVVPQVRAHAATLLERSIDKAPAETLAALLPLVDALGERTRARTSPLLGLVRERVRVAGLLPDESQPLEVQRALLRLHGLSAELETGARLLMARRALAAGELDVALALSRAPDEALRTALAEEFAVHAASRLRVRAAQLLKGRLLPLLVLSVDRRAEVRAAARKSLGDAIEEQRDHARSVVDSGAAAEGGASSAALIGALGSLSEIGRPADAARISRFLHDERSRVQAEALRALVGSQTGGELQSFVDVLLDKLASSSTRVAVEAARGLQWVPATHLPVSTLEKMAPALHADARKIIVKLVQPGDWSA